MKLGVHSKCWTACSRVWRSITAWFGASSSVCNENLGIHVIGLSAPDNFVPTWPSRTPLTNYADRASTDGPETQDVRVGR